MTCSKLVIHIWVVREVSFNIFSHPTQCTVLHHYHVITIISHNSHQTTMISLLEPQISQISSLVSAMGPKKDSIGS